MQQHKKTILSIILGFAALMFVFAYFPAAPNSQMPGQDAFMQPNMGSNGFAPPGTASPQTQKELLPEGRLSDIMEQPSQPIQPGAGGSQDLSKMMDDMYGSTRSDLPVVQGRNPSAMSAQAMPPMQAMPSMQGMPFMQGMPMQGMPSMQGMQGMPPMQGMQSMQFPPSTSSMPMQQYPAFPGMQQQSLVQTAPATGGFALPGAPKKDLWSSIFGSGDNKDEGKKAEEKSRRESSYSATQYELSVARSKASQAQSQLDRVRSVSTTSEKQSAAYEARYYASEARAAADRASNRAQGNPDAQSLVSAARAEADRASSAASYASSEASY